jgi:hypothetical protein
LGKKLLRVFAALLCGAIAGAVGDWLFGWGLVWSLLAGSGVFLLLMLLNLLQSQQATRT